MLICYAPAPHARARMDKSAIRKIARRRGFPAHRERRRPASEGAEPSARSGIPTAKGYHALSCNHLRTHAHATHAPAYAYAGIRLWRWRRMPCIAGVVVEDEYGCRSLKMNELQENRGAGDTQGGYAFASGIGRGAYNILSMG